MRCSGCEYKVRIRFRKMEAPAPRNPQFGVRPGVGAFGRLRSAAVGGAVSIFNFPFSIFNPPRAAACGGGASGARCGPPPPEAAARAADAASEDTRSHEKPRMKGLSHFQFSIFHSPLRQSIAPGPRARGARGRHVSGGPAPDQRRLRFLAARRSAAAFLSADFAAAGFAADAAEPTEPAEPSASTPAASAGSASTSSPTIAPDRHQ